MLLTKSVIVLGNLIGYDVVYVENMTKIITKVNNSNEYRKRPCKMRIFKIRNRKIHYLELKLKKLESISN